LLREAEDENAMTREQSKVRYGLYVPNYGKAARPETLVHLASEAEEHGWDGFFLWDSISGEDRRLPTVDAFTTLAAMAVNTKRIRLGTTVTALARRRPWKVARETVTIDHLSNGRLTLGVGLGFPPDQEFSRFGEDPNDKVRAAKLDEALEVMVGLWSGKPFAYRGARFTVKRTQFLPPSKQKPRIPIWVGGFWPHKRPFIRAAKWDGVIPLVTPMKLPQADDLRTILSYINRHRTSKMPYDVVKIGWTSGVLRKKDAEKIRLLAEAGMTWWLESLYGKTNSLEKMRKRILMGPPRLY
jgi:alkanesulfonate monooxygenase SsuD/methylene tetrahydromethanopterin reductase-like flavin-dependent oxidoreductase (luciferase family)